jgi:uncharacterized protein
VAADEVDFIGAGLAFPFRVDGSGRLALVRGADDIDRSLRVVLGTAKGERVMRPAFGCGIWDLVFEPLTDNTLGLMAQAVRDAVSQWEPRAELEEVVVTADPDRDGAVLIRVAYRPRDTNDRRNLVYPFYVIPREDEA